MRFFPADAKGSPRAMLAGGWVLLAVLVAAVYGQGWGHEFVNFDDPMYISENGHVGAGLTAEGLRWAWTNKDAMQWQPLTWMGHMALSELGPGAAPHLMANLVLHGMTAGLLLTWLGRLTGAWWRSLGVAVLFALHPVNVESVAWASQLKSTLSTFWLIVALSAYTRYAREGSRLAYAGALLASVAGLLAKPMAVTLPLMLGLLDFWPLRRLPGGGGEGAISWAAWVKEKIPFAVVALAGAVVTAVPWGPRAEIHTVTGLPWERVLAVPVNYVRYLKLVAWPADLAVLYPENLDVRGWQVAGALGLLAAVSAAAWRLRRDWPALAFGWGWWLVTLIPVSGLIRIGPQGWADRYVYVPEIGLLVALCWGLGEAWRRRPSPVVPAGVAALALGWGVMAYGQAGVWKNSVTLWRQAAAVTPPSATRHINLGNALLAAGRDAEAEEELRASLRFETTNPRPYVNFAVLAQKRGDGAEAIRLLRHALSLDPADARTCSNLGALLQDAGKMEEARGLLERAIALRPDLSEAQTNLGVWCASTGDLAGALKHFGAAAQLKPGDATARHNLELVRRQMGGR